ncbi:MAG TPA: cytidine deaminase [Anaerolineaceae bacterium]|nr:cytidine deaminase [Anaerolineaceae bacterium]
MLSNHELIQKAHSVLYRRQLSLEVTTGEVSAALVTEQGNVYVGVSISASCGIGFCAEHSAIANMVTQGESRILKIVAVAYTGSFLPPCGRCRELIYEINHANLNTEVMLSAEKTVRLSQLLPERWQDSWKD